MEIKIIKNEKNLLEFELDNLTIAEIVRKYLWKNKSIIVAGWKREHPSKPIILTLKTKGEAKKILKEAINGIRKDIKEIKQEIKKIK